MAETEYLGLTKAGLDAAADITVYDENLDKIDAAVKSAAEHRTALSGMISAEATDRDTAVTAEAKTRAAADKQLEARVNEESEARQAADDALQENINAKANAVHTHVAGDIAAGTFSATGIKAKSGTDYSTARVRNIKAGTDDLTAGSSALTSGDIYLVYE